MSRLSKLDIIYQGSVNYTLDIKLRKLDIKYQDTVNWTLDT